ncbi:MAG: hypothetical protein ACRD1E_09150 [Terriglobales bacterium]
MKGNNFGRIFLAVVIASFVLEFCGGLLMRSAMLANGGVPWRPDPTTMGMAMFALISIVFAFPFTYIFQQGYRGGGAAEGMRYAIWITLLASVVPNLVFGTLLPEGRRLPLEFIAVDLVTFLVCGALAGALASKGAARGAGA